MSLKEAVQMQGHLIKLYSLSLLKWQKLLLHFYWITRNAALLWQYALSKQSLSSSFTLFCLILILSLSISLDDFLGFSLSRSLSLLRAPSLPISPSLCRWDEPGRKAECFASCVWERAGIPTVRKLFREQLPSCTGNTSQMCFQAMLWRYLLIEVS